MEMFICKFVLVGEAICAIPTYTVLPHSLIIPVHKKIPNFFPLISEMKDSLYVIF